MKNTSAMKNIFKLSSLLAFALLMCACGKNGAENETENTNRVIVYAVDGNEASCTLTCDAEWNAMIDQFCNYAMEGQSVTFYDLGAQPRSNLKGVGARKEATSFTTSNRDEMKEWMKRMERDGKTVSVTYDRQTGTWSGTAYANVPCLEGGECHKGTLLSVPLPTGMLDEETVALQVSADTLLYLVKDGYMSAQPDDFAPGLHLGDTVTLCGLLVTAEMEDGNYMLILDISDRSFVSITGTWSCSCISTTTMGSANYLLSTSIYVPEANNETMLFTFATDGEATLTRRQSHQSANTQSGTWNLSPDGQLCCDLLPGGSIWSINWLSGSTLIISCTTSDTDEGDVYHQIQLTHCAE